MLTFHRPAFKTGIMVIVDQDPDGNVVKHVLKPTDHGMEVGMILDEAFVAGKYPEWFLTKGEAVKRTQDRKKAKKEKKTFVRS